MSRRLVDQLVDELQLDGHLTPHAAAVCTVSALDILRHHRWAALRLIFAPKRHYEPLADQVVEQHFPRGRRHLRPVPPCTGDAA